jgi:polar amino acid transport system substrate-binding protein
MEADGEYTGMAIDLWEELADRLGVESEYRLMPTIRELVDGAASGELDIAVTNLTITKSREERIDFTHPWYDAGLRIMVDRTSPTGFWDVIGGLRSSGHLRAYAWLGFVIIIATIVMTLFDRHFDKDFPSRWRDGFAESFYSVMSVATSGRPPSRKNLFGWVGRIWSAIWLVCGIAVLAYVTSSVTSVMTTLSLTGEVNELSDLDNHNRTAGVFTGSTAEEFADQSGFRARSYADIDAAAAALLRGRIAAIIADAPVLEYYAHQHPGEPVDVVGEIFEPDKYGFGLADRSPLTRPLNIELLGAKESGFVDELNVKYFGEE